jgi:Raf kinase inhibitor-like YbhB/YbcL family protein
MKRSILGAASAAAMLAISTVCLAGEIKTLTVTVAGLEAGGRLPLSSAYCTPNPLHPAEHNISPAVSWSAGPPGTRSYALIMTDLDVPKDLSRINKPGVTIGPDEPRVPFIHWVLVDIKPNITSLPKGADSTGFIPRGNRVGRTPLGVRGANVFSHFYPKGSPLHGIRGGYDGPCPPKNDTVPHRYVTHIYALDVPSLKLSGTFFGEEALRRMQGHILAVGQADASYQFRTN